MQLLVTMQSLGKKRPALSAVPFCIEGAPRTLRELITASVQACVASYNARTVPGDLPAPMTEESLAALQTMGKLTFGVVAGPREAVEPAAAVQTALQGFEDGLYRMFLGDKELTELDAPLSLHENDMVTLIRLTFLTGGVH